MLKNSESFLTATISIDGEDAALNSCNVFFPSIKDNKIEVEITSGDKRITNLSIDEFRISGSKSNATFNSSCQLSIINGCIIFSESKPNELLGDLENKVRLVPKETYIMKKIANDNSNIAIVEFYVNKAPIITPHTSTIQNPLGSLIKNNLTELHLNIGDNINISSEVNYNFESDNENITMQPYLVITTEIEKKTEDLPKLINEEILPKVEDFLLISSFIQQDKITCKGWEASYNGVQTSYYRTYMSHADDIKKKGDVLIDTPYVSDFLNITVKKLQESKFKDAIKIAINALNNSNSFTFELSFILMFQAVESLVNTYKREMNLEFILPNKNFKTLSKKIKDSMKSQEFKKLLNDGDYESIIKKYLN